MPPLTRGPLPARVYWVRRLAVLSVALLLVVGIARLLGGGSDASSGDDTAAQVAAGTTPSVTTSSLDDAESSSPPATSGSPAKGKGKKDKDPGKTQTSEAPVLADPEGPCTGSDIAVTPKVSNAVAGRDVLIVLQLRTLQSPACTWRVSDNALTVKITSGKDQIWSSSDCPKAIPVRDVVVRQAVTTNVGVTWKQAKRSGDRCVLDTGWALPGWYHVTASALAGEPSDLQFELTTPVAGTVTRTADPTQSPSSD